MSDAATRKEIATEVEVTPRQTVFISNSNPEDNEFAPWLGTRLIGAGYQVWSDLLRLVGGRPFWRDIGHAIRGHAAVVILLLSRALVTKPGVLDEIALAVATWRKLQNTEFIVPIRLDDLPTKINANVGFAPYRAKKWPVRNRLVAVAICAHRSAPRWSGFGDTDI